MIARVQVPSLTPSCRPAAAGVRDWDSGLDSDLEAPGAARSGTLGASQTNFVQFPYKILKRAISYAIENISHTIYFIIAGACPSQQKNSLQGMSCRCPRFLLASAFFYLLLVDCILFKFYSLIWISAGNSCGSLLLEFACITFLRSFLRSPEIKGSTNLPPRNRSRPMQFIYRMWI